MTARTIGCVRAERPGPTLLVVGAIHGNEPAGVIASQRVLERLAADRVELRGEFVCLVGNAGAFARGVRQSVRDLNRSWTDERLAAVRAGAVPIDAEDVELAELSRAIDDVCAAARGDVCVLDLHTTSGDGAPFALVAATPASRAFGREFPVTCVAGLLELLDGTMLVALARRGVAGAVVEAGRHDDPASADRAEAAVWVALAAAGLLDESRVPRVTQARRLLDAARGDLPAAIDVTYRHAIRPEDAFRMRPGYRHFQRVTQGEVLAGDARGDVRAPQTGYILMPLYQGTGSDGFFLGR